MTFTCLQTGTQTFLFFSSMCSVFFILSMTFERFYSIIRPHKAVSFNTVIKAKITIAFITVFSVLYNSPHLFISAFDGEGCIPYGSVVENFNNLAYYWFTVTIVFVLPFVLLLTVDTVEGVCNGFLALYTFFWLPEFSGYHQWQQESQ